MNKHEPSRKVEVLGDFILYCREHPNERFWQALRNWSGRAFIIAAQDVAGCAESSQTGYPWTNLSDTFYWEGKTK